MFLIHVSCTGLRQDQGFKLTTSKSQKSNVCFPSLHKVGSFHCKEMFPFIAKCLFYRAACLPHGPRGISLERTDTATNVKAYIQWLQVE